MRAMLRTVVVLSVALSGSLALAQSDDEDDDGEILANAGAGLLNAPTALDLYVGGTVESGRRDVREVSRSAPPSGPATPVPYCGPSSPICP